MNLDSRLLSFPLYVCCNFLYTSPHLDNRLDSSEQDSTVRCVSWCQSSHCHSSRWSRDTDTSLYVQSTTIFNTIFYMGHIVCMLCTSVRCDWKMFVCLCISCFGTFWVYCVTETHHSGREGSGHARPPEPLHFSSSVCHELSEWRCRASHQNGKPPSTLLWTSCCLDLVFVTTLEESHLTVLLKPAWNCFFYR